MTGDFSVRKKPIEMSDGRPYACLPSSEVFVAEIVRSRFGAVRF
jgi:hypothetical protein